MDQIDRAAAAAGAWWAELLSDDYDEHRMAFASAVADLVARRLRGEIAWETVERERDGYILYTKVRVNLDPPRPERWVGTEFDYDPDVLLYEALVQAIPEVEQMSKWDIGGLLPQKHSLHITPTRLTPKEGYGQFRPAFDVPTS